MSNWIEKEIISVYEQEHPALVQRIKDIVIDGRTSRSDFERYLRSKFPTTYSTSITVSASFVLFDRFMKERTKITTTK